MRVLITGATGYLGRAIVRAVAAAGLSPIAFARRASSAGLSVPAIDGDITDAHAVFEAVRQCDIVCHVAALVSLWQRDAAAFDRVNVDGTTHILDAVERLQIRRCVYTSSFLALPPAGHTAALTGNDYQRTKARALATVRARVSSGLPVVSLFPGVIYGPGRLTESHLVGRLMHDRLQRRLPASVGLDRHWSLTFIDDVARAHVRACTSNPVQAEYGVGGHNVPQRAIFNWLDRQRGTGIPLSLPLPVARTTATLAEYWARVTNRPPTITRGAVEIFAHDWPVDSRDACRDLGYTITPLEHGLCETLTSLDADDQR